MNRRSFLLQTGLCGAALLCPACRKRPSPAAPEGTFPVVVARGSPFEVGAAIGAASRDRIARLVKRREKWFTELLRFALADRSTRIDGFARATAKHHPEIMAELRGLAKGAQRPLDEILVLNLQPELGALKHRCQSAEKPAKVGCGDCSTLHLVQGGRILLAHNEDDHHANRDLMALLRVAPTGRPTFVSLSYPGVIPGNVPAMTGAGLMQTTNFIGGSEVRVGVPRYVLGRAILDARNIDEAVQRAVNPDGAYSFHVNLGSKKEQRLVSIEVAPGGRHDLRDTRQDLYVHTNHFLLPGTKAVPQIATYAGGSSDSRYRILQRARKTLPPLAKVGPEHLTRLLSSHQAIKAPYSPCRHPHGDIQGQTMAMALFDVR
ncbi:MAG: C45 family peptidase, partial [bacterium]